MDHTGREGMEPTHGSHFLADVWSFGSRDTVLPGSDDLAWMYNYIILI